MKKPLITIFVPYYNDENYLNECIDSILMQSFLDFELILLDHASTDNSTKIAHSYKDERIKHISMEDNNGAGGGLLMREVLNIAQGIYYKPFCADDVMRPDCLEKLVNYFYKKKDVDLVFGDMIYINSKSELLNNSWWRERPILNMNEVGLLKLFLNGQSLLPYPSSFCKLSILKEIKIDYVLHAQFDMTLWIQILSKGFKVELIDEPIVNYRIHPKQASSSSKLERLFRISNLEGINYCDYFFINSISLIKKILPSNMYANLLVRGDENLIQFVLCMHFLRGDIYQYRLFALLKISQILNDDFLRSLIKNKFKYSIRDFRNDYAETNIFNDPRLFSSLKLIKILRKKFKAQIYKLFPFKKKLYVV